MILYDAEQLTREAQGTLLGNRRCHCLERDLTGWTGWPATYHEDGFVRLGTLAQHDREAATLDEYHPAGTTYWSPEAPIAPRYYPYNQCVVWACVTCARLYLRHDDEGAYHCERRIRRVSPALVVDAPLVPDTRNRVSS